MCYLSTYKGILFEPEKLFSFFFFKTGKKKDCPDSHPDNPNINTN